MSNIEEIRSIVAKVPDAQVLSDLDATVAWAVKSGQGDKSRLAVTGFCWGGWITWLYAAHNPNVRTGAAWYGRLVGNSTLLTPKHPADIASALTVPIFGLYGGQDTGIPLDTVETLRNRLKSSSSKSEIIVYPDAPHAFFADCIVRQRQRMLGDACKLGSNNMECDRGARNFVT